MVTRSMVRVVLHGAAQELELPARLAFQIKDARLARVHVHQPRHDVVLGVLFARQRVDGRLDGLDAAAAPALNRTRLHSARLPSSFSVTILLGQDLGAVLQRDLGLLPGVAMLMEADLRGQARIRQSARAAPARR